MNDAADRLEVQLTAMQKEIQEAEREQRRSAALGIAAPSILTSQESIKTPRTMIPGQRCRDPY